jgi:signal transduction histidine kinase/ligand-binding sensor domain-containing protein/CheY-like chemotaxis protein
VRRFPLFLTFGLYVSAGVGTTTPDGTKALPVIDKRDIRFIPLSVDGEPFQKRVVRIAQDNYGFMWLGTDDGLYRCDGYTLRPYRHDPSNPRSLGDNSPANIYKDRAGTLWIGTEFGGLDRFNPAQDTFTHYRHDPNDRRSLWDDHIASIHQDLAGALWVGTYDGFDRLDLASGRFFHYPLPAEANLDNKGVGALYEDRQGNLLIGTHRGVYKVEQSSDHLARSSYSLIIPSEPDKGGIADITLDRSGVLWAVSWFGNEISALNIKTGELTHYAFNSEGRRSQELGGAARLHEDRNGVLWIGTCRNGLLRFDKDRKNFIRYSTRRDGGFPDRIWSLFEDTEGNMWVGGESGVSRFQTAPRPFVNYQRESDDPTSLRSNKVLAVHADAQGFLWIGTAGGLHRLDRKTGQMVVYQHNPKDRNSLSDNAVSAIQEDGSGGLWIGTHGGGLDRFNRASGQFFAYRHNPEDPYSLSSDIIMCLWVEPGGVLWAGTEGGGLDRFDAATGRLKAYRNDPRISNSLSHDIVRTIFTDRGGSLWVGTNRGLDRFDRGTDRFTVYLHNERDPASLSHDGITSIDEDRQGTLWVGTRRGLDRLDRTRGSFASFTTKDGLANDGIEDIQEDRRGNLWLATHEGFSEFNPQTKTVHNYSESDGLPGDYQNPTGTGGRSCVAPEGELVFGSEHGVTVFNPDRVSANSFLPPVVLTNFLLFNKPVLPGRDSPLQQPIWAAHSVTLDHKQSIFTLQFAALSYVAPERNRYRYKLENLEKEWNEVGTERRVATYTSLPPGEYVFRVQGSNNDGVWNPQGASLAITVLPPWWATWWFRGLVAVLVVGLILSAYKWRVKSLKMQRTKLEIQVARRTTELQVAKSAAEEAMNAAERANESKTIFLANMSHELRTPLNAILGFSNLLRDSDVSESQREDLDIINRSGEHLLSLINSVLDMAKIDAGHIAIENGPLDLKELVSGVMDPIRVRAEEKGLELSIDQTPEMCQFVEADGEKLRQVLVNLVGNAVKYSERGSVTLRVDTQPAGDAQHCMLVMEVEDTGAGITEDDQARIFEAFVQVGKVSKRKGTGLGLAITKKYVELMGGTIQVQSELGKGSLFRLEVPVQKVDASSMPAYAVDGGRVIGLEAGQPEYRVLIVEDQVENRLLLQRVLENAGFQTQVAEDGATGIEKFLSWRPNFIWLDWRLPGANGLEVTRRMRQLEGGREVKIAILSAFAFTEDRDEALAAGVDDFVSKPFQAQEIFDCLARHLGVRYTYETGATEETTGLIEYNDLAHLPADLRKELADAVTSLDNQRIAAVIDLISMHNAELGRALSKHADRYTYSRILEALQASASVADIKASGA